MVQRVPGLRCAHMKTLLVTVSERGATKGKRRAGQMAILATPWLAASRIYRMNARTKDCGLRFWIVWPAVFDSLCT